MKAHMDILGSGDRVGSAAPALSVKGLRVEFPSAWGEAAVAIRDLDLDIQPGTIVGLVGESGAGKTTLARSILKRPPEPGNIARGEVWFEGVDLYKLTEKQLQRLRGHALSIIVPNPRGELNPLIPVGEQISALARIHLGDDRHASRARALEMLHKVQIPDPERRMKAYAHELSGGMAQRVIIAMALICSPKFVISDDATSGLDVTVQGQILDLMRALVTEQGAAMLFITRDMGIAAHFCDRTAVMYRGELMEVASRTELFMHPHNPYTIMLLAAFSHNAKLRQQWRQVNAHAASLEPGKGCPFSDRCPLAQERCHNTLPALREVAPGHFVRCHYPVRL